MVEFLCVVQAVGGQLFDIRQRPRLDLCCRFIRFYTSTLALLPMGV